MEALPLRGWWWAGKEVFHWELLRLLALNRKQNRPHPTSDSFVAVLCELAGGGGPLEPRLGVWPLVEGQPQAV